MPTINPPIRAFQWDLARQVERLDWLLAQLPRYAEWGYQELYLHLEDAVAYPSLPGVARRDAYSYRQLERLVAGAAKVGLKVVPIVNLLGHTQYLIKVPELRDLNELRHADGSPRETGQICPLHPRTLEIAEKLLRDMAPFCTAGKVHVGLDESFHLGQHPLSRREVRWIGLAAHFAGHVNRLRQLTRNHGLRMGLWADMLYFLPEAIPLLPTDLIAYDWYYYPFKNLPRVELFNYAEVDLATPLMRRGIEYWGCPMNGAFRHEPLPHFSDRLANAIAWWRRCRQIGAAGFLMTSWEPNRLALKTTTLVDAAVAGLWQQPGLNSRTALLTHGIRQLFNHHHAPAITAGLVAADRYPFTGYARWEINKRWDLASGPRSLARYRREFRHFDVLARRANLWPSALQASLDYRRYLAVRDVYVRAWQQAVLAMRRAWAHQHSLQPALKRLWQQASRFQQEWQRGRAAAETMWRETRLRATDSPNRKLLQADQQQCRAWHRWLRQCGVHAEHVLTGCPVAGPWVLSFSVWNFAPAVQRLAVDEKCPDGSWRVIKMCHTIEFLRVGAVPRAALIHCYSAPLSGSLDGPSELRLRLGGAGQVRVSRWQATNGITTCRATNYHQWQELGHAPLMGWPNLAREVELRPVWSRI